MEALIPVEMIERKISDDRGEKVMLDADLCRALWGTKQEAQRTGKKEHGQIPCRFHVHN